MQRKLRWLILACYFLPCCFFMSSCEGLVGLRLAYNKADAQPILEELAKDPQPAKTTEGFLDRVVDTVIQPTGRSLSAIGCIWLYKNKAGAVLIILSMLCSVPALLSFGFLRGKRVRLGLSLANTGFLLAFATDSMISEVSLLWGFWLLLGLVLWHLALVWSGKGLGVLKGEDGKL